MVDTQMYVMACVLLLVSALLFLLWQCRSAILARILPPEDLEIGAVFSFPLHHDIISPTGSAGAPAHVIAQLPVFRFTTDKQLQQKQQQLRRQQQKQQKQAPSPLADSAPLSKPAKALPQQLPVSSPIKSAAATSTTDTASQPQSQHAPAPCSKGAAARSCSGATATPSRASKECLRVELPGEERHQQDQDQHQQHDQQQDQQHDLDQQDQTGEAAEQQQQQVPLQVAAAGSTDAGKEDEQQLQEQQDLGQQPDQRSCCSPRDVLGNRVQPAAAAAAAAPEAAAAAVSAPSGSSCSAGGECEELAQQAGRPESAQRTSSDGCSSRGSSAAAPGPPTLQVPLQLSEHDCLTCAAGSSPSPSGSRSSPCTCCHDDSGCVDGGSSSCCGSEAQDGVLSCVICFADYSEGELVKQLPCQHCFHAGCIDKWLLRAGNCPLCKLAVWQPPFAGRRSPYLLFHF